MGGLHERALPENLADHRRVQQQPPLGPVERVEPGGEQRLHRPGQRGRLDGVLLDQAVDHLLREQGVATGALGHLRHDPGPAAVLMGGAGHQRRHQLAGLVRGERLERDRGGVLSPAAPAGPSLEELVPSEADQQQRATDPARQVVDQVEHSLVGPVDVVEREHEGSPLRDSLDHRPRR